MRCFCTLLALTLTAGPALAQTTFGSPRLEVRTDELGRRARALVDDGQGSGAPTVLASIVGTAWEPTGPCGGDVEDVAASPTATGVVLAGVTPPQLEGGGLYRSTDGGASWTAVPDLVGTSVHDLEFAADGTAWVASLDSVWTSSDDGQSFTQLDLSVGLDDEVLELTLGPGQVWAGLADAKGNQSINLLVSTDQGLTWSDRTPAGAAGTGCAGIALDPADSNKVFACFGGSFGGGSVWFSNDGGLSWADRTINLPFGPLTDLAHDGSRVLLAGGQLYQGQDVGLFESLDDGATWSTLHDASWPSLVVRDIEIDPADPLRLYVATHGAGALRSEDGGATWIQNQGFARTLHVNEVSLFPGQPQEVLLGCAVFAVMASDNGGVNYTFSHDGIRALNAVAVQMRGAPGGELALCTNGLNTGVIYTSPDGGETWALQKAPRTRWNEVDFGPDAVLYALSGGPVTEGQEGVWTRVSNTQWLALGPDQGPLYESDLASIRISKSNNLWLVGGRDAGSAGDESALWRSDDQGASWSRVYEGNSHEVFRDAKIFSHTTGPEIALACFTDEGPDQTGGLLRTDDGGLSWTQITGSLPAGLQGSSLIHAPNNAHTALLADSAPSAGGVYLTVDEGLTWTPSAGISGPVLRVERDAIRAKEHYAVRAGSSPLVEKSADLAVNFTPYDLGLDPSLTIADAVFFEGVHSALEQCDYLLLATHRGLWKRLLHCALEADVPDISISAGGTQVLTYSAGFKHAFQYYLMLGSSAGTQPGFDLGGGKNLPLNPSPWFNYTLTSANVPPFTNTFGQFDALGISTAQVSLPPGSPPQMVGLTLYHAFIAVTAPPGSTIELASNACALNLVP